MAGKEASTNGGAVQAVAAALAARPGSRAAELADEAGVGQSTAAKALAALEGSGQATRVSGGRGNNGRRQPDRWHPPQPPASSPGAKRSAISTAEEGTRLGRGELATLVAEYLADRSAEEVGPVAVAKGLGRSSGAVANALTRLAKSGTVLLVGDQPRRYRLAQSLNGNRELAG